MIYGAVSIFAIAYVLMLVFSKYRPYIALGSALIFIVKGYRLCSVCSASRDNTAFDCCVFHTE